MGVPNRESVAEALARSDDIVSVFLAEGDSKHIDTLVAAARAWLDQGDALVIRKDEAVEEIKHILRTQPLKFDADHSLTEYAESMVDALSDRSDE